MVTGEVGRRGKWGAVKGLDGFGYFISLIAREPKLVRILDTHLRYISLLTSIC